MPFAHNLFKAAHRHLDAAERLFDGNRKDVAGYLYGIAAECAVKYMLSQPSLPGTSIITKKEMLYLHFPELLRQLRDALSGRSGTPLWRLVGTRGFFNHWHISMRYADARQILPRWVEQWRENAKQAINTMDT